jgi:hypothetical protein
MRKAAGTLAGSFNCTVILWYFPLCAIEGGKFGIELQFHQWQVAAVGTDCKPLTHV